MPRPYRDSSDLEKMLSILTEGRQANNYAYYIHPGDLQWWLYYSAPGTDPFKFITLWESEQSPGRIIAWTLLSPPARAFDVYIHPEWIRTDIAKSIYAWSAEELTRLVKQAGGNEITFVWAAVCDTWLKSLLSQIGFSQASEGYLNLQHSMKARIPIRELPHGYILRSGAGETEFMKRAEAQYSAFGARMPFEDYQQRFAQFVHSPVYQADHDVVIEAPDKRIAAFCYLWFDDTNSIGLFEPVGVHVDFQRKGLGKALMQEGLRRMQAAGIKKAMLNVEENNWAARRLYQNVGFKYAETLVTFHKRLGMEPE